MQLSDQLYASQCPFRTHHVVVETNSIQFCISMLMASYTDSNTINKQTQTKSRHEQDTINKCYNYNDKTK